jgi:hypothetical protein
MIPAVSNSATRLHTARGTAHHATRSHDKHRKKRVFSTAQAWSLVAPPIGVWSRDSGLSTGVWSRILIVESNISANSLRD